MAVYTNVPSETLAEFISRFDCGRLVSAKGIAEGIENSNYLIDTTAGRYILTLYEKRVAADDLPFFMSLLDHLSDAGNPVPPAIPDRERRVIHELCGRPACLIKFLPGVSPTRPRPDHARAAGAALGAVHESLKDFAQNRENPLGPDGWLKLLSECGRDLDKIEPGLFDGVSKALHATIETWPGDLPHAVIHADLFPDNVLLTGERVTGLIDFYFACTEIRAYDLAVMHSAWSFDPDGGRYVADVGDALVEGYAGRFALTSQERTAMPLLARGACLRFVLTRAWDWLNTPADALVTRKDPLAYWRRYALYAERNPFA